MGQTCLQTPFDMQFINDSTGFVVGSFTNAYCDISYTTNYGATWQSINLPYAYAGWGVYAFDTANVYLVGQNQSIIKVGTNGLITSLQSQSPTLAFPKREESVSCYPNPATNQLTIYNLLTTNYSLTIQNIVGETIDTKQNCNAQETIDVSGFAKGVYFVRVGEKINKFIKQ
jgi:hypothetical protein